MWWAVQIPSWQSFERAVKLLGGMTFFAHEVFLSTADRPYLMVGILGLLGLTEMLRLDLKKKDDA